MAKHRCLAGNHLHLGVCSVGSSRSVTHFDGAVRRALLAARSMRLRKRQRAMPFLYLYAMVLLTVMNMAIFLELLGSTLWTRDTHLSRP
jgi:hypothetical protein